MGLPSARVPSRSRFRTRRGCKSHPLSVGPLRRQNGWQSQQFPSRTSGRGTADILVGRGIKITNGVALMTSGEVEATEVAEAPAKAGGRGAWIDGRRMIATRETRVTGTSGTCMAGTRGTSLAGTIPGATIVVGTDLMTGDVEIEVVAVAEAGVGVEGVEGAAAVAVAAAGRRKSSRLSSSCSPARSIWAPSSRCGDTWISRARYKAPSRRRA